MPGFFLLNLTKKYPLRTRLEPRCRDDNFARGLEARIADPLWLLCRQRAFGEYQGEDTGSPIRVCLSTETSRLPEVEEGPPPEAIVERVYTDRAQVEQNWRLRVQIGQHLERLLRAAPGMARQAVRIICQLRQLYPITPPTPEECQELDRATQRFRTAMAGRALDGGRLLLEAYWGPGGEPVLPGRVRSVLAPNLAAAVEKAVKALVTWFKALYGELRDAAAPSSWISEKLEYAFQLDIPAQEGEKVTLVAPSYRSGDLDWHTFSLATDPIDTEFITTATQQFVPTRVSFHGMPHPRWWAFEDSNTDFGNMDTITTDLAKLMIMEFALIYGNDWFQVPLPVEVGTVTRIDELVVEDVFGVRTPIPPAEPLGQDPLQAWSMFQLSLQGSPEKVGKLLFLAPTVNFREESEPLEEVRIFRDEMANMVWAVEHTVTNHLGQPWGGFEAQAERGARLREAASRAALAELRAAMAEMEATLARGGATPEAVESRVRELQARIAALQARLAAAQPAGAGAPPAEAAALPHYRLATPVPANWIPFIPVRQPGTDRQVFLKQAAMLTAEDGPPVVMTPLTRLLAGVNGVDKLARLREEAVTRAGQKYQLTRQRVRWVNGRTYLWLGRKVVPGQGEGSSGLRFDVLED